MVNINQVNPDLGMLRHVVKTLLASSYRQDNNQWKIQNVAGLNIDANQTFSSQDAATDYVISTLFESYRGKSAQGEPSRTSAQVAGKTQAA